VNPNEKVRSFSTSCSTMGSVVNKKETESRILPIAEAFSRALSAEDALDRALSALSERLQPIMNEDYSSAKVENNNDVKTENGNSMIAEQIGDLANHFESFAIRIEHLLFRLEL
jgi:hypothetical protein